ncbi:MAG: 50S ribosome-binding GTPase [Thermofilum sp.]|jgi:ribosome biogenesis GTPase A|nr:50S ribosome-binding GTPase [Thermofilum sp.]
MSLAQLRRLIKKVDVVLEVVDARDPWGTRSIEVERYAEKLGKPIVLVINKSDLVPAEVLKKWKNILGEKYPVVFISASKRLGTSNLWKMLKKYASMRRGKKFITVAVVGIPNVGKSALINYLKGAHSVGASPIPGYTKAVTRLRVSRWLRVYDTPGIVPKLSAEELAIRGALRPEALEDPVPAAVKLIELILKKNPALLKNLYGVETGDPYQFLEEFARKRGLLRKGGEPIIEEAARIVIRDWQAGKNHFYLEPEDYSLLPRALG